MEPFLKWAGGKRWLIPLAADILPDHRFYNRYFEPFLGGGSLFFHLEPDAAFLSDINKELINTYIILRDSWQDLIEILKEYDSLHSVQFYYETRSSEPESSLYRAARLIYLNRTCWNGLYRVNSQGRFNVPIGSKSNVLLNVENFHEIAALLRNAIIGDCDFEETINQAGVGDFVFIDPPYTVKHDLNGFLKYNETIFSWDDQVRLKNAVQRAIDRGALVLIMNANHDSINNLYEGIGDKVILSRESVISGKSSARGLCKELAIKSW